MSSGVRDVTLVTHICYHYVTSRPSVSMQPNLVLWYTTISRNVMQKRKKKKRKKKEKTEEEKKKRGGGGGGGGGRGGYRQGHNVGLYTLDLLLFLNQ